MILSALPVYWIFVCWEKPGTFTSTISKSKKTHCFSKLTIYHKLKHRTLVFNADRVTVVFQKLLLTVPEEKRKD